MDGWGVLERASELARQGQAFALATVVWRQGPSSGQLGSRAIITADGEVHGWIGGACAEPVVIREARQVIADGEPRLLLLGTPDQFGETVPDGMTVVPIACQSEGALEVFIEPVQPAPRLVIVGRSPMAQTLAALARGARLAHRADRWPEFSAADADEHSMVVVATQGHGDEEAMEQAVAAGPPTSAWSPRSDAARPSSATSRTGACPRTSSTGSGCRPASTSGGPRTGRSRSRSWPNWSSSAPRARSAAARAVPTSPARAPPAGRAPAPTPVMQNGLRPEPGSGPPRHRHRPRPSTRSAG